MSRISILAIAFMFTVSALFAEVTNEKSVKILTNAHCGSCKASIEKALNKEAGVIESNLNLKNKIVEVRYNADVTNPDNLTKSIVAAKYEAKVLASGEKSKVKSDAKDCDAKCMKKCEKKCSDEMKKDVKSAEVKKCAEECKTTGMKSKSCCSSKK